MTTAVVRLIGRVFGRSVPTTAGGRRASWLTRVSISGVEQPFDVVFYQDDAGWFIAEVPELPGCHTQGQTRTELLVNVREAIELTRESRLALGLPEREDLASRPAPVLA